jgi:hypothetical protein
MTGPQSENEAGVQPEGVLSDPDELLFRQVHPLWCSDGVPSSQAFGPTKKDEGKLSITRSSLTTAMDAYINYTTVQGLASAGVWGITVGEAAAVELKCFDDPQPDIPAHGYVDFGDLPRRQAQRKAQVLVAKARSRGCLYSLT